MRKEFLRVAILIPVGITLGLLGVWSGWLIALAGAVLLVFQWRTRDARPLDPILKANLDEAMKLEKSDPAAAERLLDRAVKDAERREEQELADLRDRAVNERAAAIELRSRLRGKLRNDQAARRMAEKHAANSPNGAALLEEMDRATSKTQQRLAEAEQYLANFRNR